MNIIIDFELLKWIITAFIMGILFEMTLEEYRHGGYRGIERKED